MSELAITKAAAWAWLQHGPGSPDSVRPEYGHTRTRRVHRPSRYKVEADKLKVQNREGSHLLDRYEIEMISKRINDYVKVDKCETRSVEESGKKLKNNNIRKGLGAFWVMNGIACVPREDDVVDITRVWPRPKKSVDVIAKASGVKMTGSETVCPVEDLAWLAKSRQRSEWPANGGPTGQPVQATGRKRRSTAVPQHAANIK